MFRQKKQRSIQIQLPVPLQTTVRLAPIEIEVDVASGFSATKLEPRKRKLPNKILYYHHRINEFEDKTANFF